MSLSLRRRNFTPLHWACEARNTAELRRLLRQDGSCLERKTRGTRYTPLQLAQTSGPPVGAPVSEAVLAMTRAALSPWEPAAHGLWPLSFRRGARALMLVSRRLVQQGAGAAMPVSVRAIPRASLVCVSECNYT